MEYHDRPSKARFNPYPRQTATPADRTKTHKNHHPHSPDSNPNTPPAVLGSTDRPIVQSPATPKTSPTPLPQSTPHYSHYSTTQIPDRPAAIEEKLPHITHRTTHDRTRNDRRHH